MSRSALIFGPPETGKSTMARGVAAELGWDYVEITPGDFLAGGDFNIIHNANQIFKRLIRMKNTVVFFDEVDQLVKSRKYLSGGKKREKKKEREGRCGS